MTEIDDVGGVTAQCVVDYLSSSQAKDLLQRLKDGAPQTGQTSGKR